MEDFFFDKIGNGGEENEKTLKNESSDDSDEFLNSEELGGFGRLLNKFEYKETKPKKGFGFENTYIITNYKNRSKEENVEGPSTKVDKLLEKSFIKPGLEKCHSLPKEKSKRALMSQRKKLRQKTKGENWFDMPATELTDEIKTDFELLKMRSVLDRKHVYKKNDITRIPKYFQVGKVIESPADFYGGRIPKSQRKKTMVDELLADAEFKKYQKKKFKEIMDENRRNKRTKKNLKGRKVQKGKLRT